MLAVKLARHVSGRQLIIKAWDAYHGSYDDLEVGLQNQGEIPGRVALATFGEIETYENIVKLHKDEIAAIVLEPVQYTGVVTPPPEGFLQRLRELADAAGALLIVDDCLMFRLAEGGSAERFGFQADITCLGKWIGGGLPVGVIAAGAEMMSCFDLDPDNPLYHGGSFNGNLLGMAAGAVALRDFTAAEIARIDAQAERLKAGILAAGEACGVAVRAPGVGSAFGLYVVDGPDGPIDWEATKLLHLAAVTHGVYYGSGGEFGLSTAVTDEDVEQAGRALGDALADVAKATKGLSETPSV
jgi:glutamate-1-semialdehyde 2,1-aminomutase